MSFAIDLLNRLFQPSASPNEPLVSETLERSKNDKMSYQKWLQASKHRELSQIFSLSYFLKKKHITCSANVHIFNSRAANAFSISCSDYIEPKSFQHYFDYLKNTVVGLGYAVSSSERDIIDRTHYIETIDRHYLKFPEIHQSGDLCHQLYGNILIEHISVDDRPSYIKLMVTYQNDIKYTKPLSFDELTRLVFDF